MSDPAYKKITDIAGNVTFVPIPAQAEPVNESFADIATAAVKSIAPYMAARAGEHTTAIGSVGGAIATPQLIDMVTNTIASAAAGNIVGAVSNGLPAVISIAGILGAIFLPQSTGPTNDQIITAIASLSRADRIRLLQESDATSGNLPASASGLQSSATG